VGRLRPLLVTMLALAITLSGALLAIAAPSGSQAAPTTTLVPLDDQPVRSPSIIPTPNSTSQPTQYLVMAAIVVALVVIGLLIRRESRQHPERRTPSPSNK